MCDEKHPMNKFQSALDSFSSKGGMLMILVGFVLLMFCMVLFLLYRPGHDASIVAVILSTFSAFTGALLSTLNTSLGGQRKTDTATNGGDGKGAVMTSTTTSTFVPDGTAAAAGSPAVAVQAGGPLVQHLKPS